MKLRILDVAEADLLRGFRFYQRKCKGVGWYFLESLYAEIDSLHLYAGIHRRFSGLFSDVVSWMLTNALPEP